MTTQSLPDDFIKLAYQLHSFRATKHKYAERTKVVDDVIDRLVARYPNYSAIRYTSEGRYSRSSSIDPIALVPSPNDPYPSDWAIDRSRFSKAIRRFSIFCDKYVPDAPYAPSKSGSNVQNTTRFEPTLRVESTPPSDVTEEIPRRAVMPDRQAEEDAGAQRDRQPLLSPEMASEIATLINSALDTRDRERQRRRERADTGGERGANNLAQNSQSSISQNSLALGFGNDFNQVNASGISMHWSPEDIGFFEPTTLEDTDYEYQGKATIWKNVYLFVDSFKFNAREGRDAIVRRNLHSCLRGIVQRWYTEEIEETTRLAFRFVPEGIKV